MAYYDKHLFFCINQRDADRPCCANKNAKALYEYAKKRIKTLSLEDVGRIRVNQSGCLGRCKQGPIIVIYPDAAWYTYNDEKDIDAIIEQHLIKKQLVSRLLLPKEIAAENTPLTDNTFDK